jgi:hypothetical protein
MGIKMHTTDRWLGWKPKAQIFSKSPGDEPSKTSKTPQNVGEGVFEVFDGSVPGEIQNILPESDRAKLTLASSVLGRAGVRLMELETGFTVGVWSDLDSAELRAAIRVFHPDGVPSIRYLDSDVPMKYKSRRVPGAPVPPDVLHAMEQNPEVPWEIRDRLLREMGWRPQGISWAEAKAAALNQLFKEQCGKPGRITAATVRHGEQTAHLAEESEVPDGE